MSSLVSPGGPILPGAVIGVLGSGQLGRMLALEAGRMGYRVHTLSPGKDTPTGQVADREDIEVPAVDGSVRLNVVCRPHGARMVPTQPMDEPLVLVFPHA